MLTVEGLDVDISNIPILRQIQFNLESGEIVGLIGRNGAGKTTLMRSIMGLLAAKSGSIQFDQASLQTLPGHRRAHMGIGYMPEDRRLVPEMTAEQNILLPVWSTDIPEYEDRLQWIYKIIPECMEFRQRAATSLSGGQQKLVALARALMVGQNLLLLDEPTEGIAPVLVQRMCEILADLKKEGVSILIAESNDAHIAELLDRSYVIERGSLANSK
ncbi:MAG: ATP-binding cassette domain-containing protein [Rhodospirillaceae bacterium]|nr:ATP-binding cassette domain-containing protein [Rhodospirillaceae bacterium]